MLRAKFESVTSGDVSRVLPLFSAVLLHILRSADY